MSDWHKCHFCGEDVKDGKDPKGNRHWLSDCRPDLVEHEIGPDCTWPEGTSRTDTKPGCYAYQDFGTQKWTDEHTHFHKDGPM